MQSYLLFKVYLWALGYCDEGESFSETLNSSFANSLPSGLVVHSVLCSNLMF